MYLAEEIRINVGRVNAKVIPFVVCDENTLWGTVSHIINTIYLKV